MINEIRFEGRLDKRDFPQMSLEHFFELRIVTPLIRAQDTILKEALPPEQRLPVTLQQVITALKVFRAFS